MSKNIKLVSGIVVAVVGTSVGASVSADTVENPPVLESTVEVSSTSNKSVTQQDVAKSETELKVANQAVSDQENVVADSQNTVDSAQANTQEAKKQVDYTNDLVSQASPEKVAEVEQDIERQTSVVTNVEAEVSEAKNDVEKAEASVSKQEAKVKEASKVVASSQIEVATAQNEVEKAQNILDGTSEGKRKADKEKAEVALAEADAKVPSTVSELVKAKEADKYARIFLDEYETSVRNDKVDVNKAESVLNDTNKKVVDSSAKVSTKTADVATAKAQVKKLTDEINSKNNLPAVVYDVVKEADVATAKAQVKKLTDEINSKNNLPAVVYDVVKELVTAKETLFTAEQELATAKKENLIAKGHQVSAQLDYDNALRQLDSDKKELAFYQNRHAKTPQAELNYAIALEELKSAKLRLDNIDNLIAADIKAKEQALADAKANLVKKEQAHTNAKDELNAENSLLEELKYNAKLASQKVDTLNAKLADEKAKLAKLVQNLEDLKNAPKVLEEAQAKLTEAKAKLTEAKANLDTKLKNLEAKKAKLKDLEAYKKVLAAQAEVKRQQEEVHKSKEEAEHQKQLTNVVAGVAQRHANPITSQYGFVKSESHSNNEVSGNATFDLFTKKGDSKSDVQLPKTGEESSLLAVAGAMLLGTLGLAGIRKRRN